MRIFKNKAFSRFAKKSGIDDPSLCKAVADANSGLIDADLGGGVIKQRVARSGAGKSGGFRTLILFRLEDKAFFIYGFAKNQRDNISSDDLAALKKLASNMLSYNAVDLNAALENNTLIEVSCYGETIP